MTSRRDLSVGQRLGIGLGVVTFVVAVLAVLVVVIGLHVRAMVARQVEVIEPRVDAAEALERAILHKAIAVRAYVISRAEPELQALGRAREDLAGRLRQLEGVPQDADGRRRLDAVLPAKAAYEKAVNGMLEVMRAGSAVGTPAMADAETAMSRSREQLLAAVRRYEDHETVVARRAREEVRSAVEPLAAVLPAAAVLVLVVSALTIVVVGRSIREPAARIVSAARALAGGDYEPALALAPAASRPDGGDLRLRDELAEVALGFTRMARLLQQREERLAARTRVAAALATSLEADRLASGVLAEVSQHLRGQVGVVYGLHADEGTLRPLATRALDRHVADLRIGHGLPGQAAADRRTLVVRDIPDDTPFRIELGVEEAPPRWIAASPMLTGDRLVGVLVVAGLGTLSDDAVDFLDDAAGRLAVTVDNARAHAALERLTIELHEKNELLQAQNEELQAQGEELQQQNEELQAQGEELLTQAEELQEHRHDLEERNARLAEAEQRKNEFLAMLGHELRNPLGAITAAAVLLRDESHGGDAPRAVDVIARQTRHLTRLVDDLLDVSRVTYGALQLTTRPVNLGEVAARTVETVTGALPHGHRRIVVDTEAVWVAADETRLEQIIGNLVTNAVKYTPDDGRIVVSVTETEGTAVLRVEDDGIGISPELLPHVFELFVQQPRSRDRARGGLGIGLTLVRHLVELHGGTVEVASDGVGKGARFTVRLPAVSVPSSAAFAAPRPRPIREACSVVLAEDNTDAREVFAVLLARAGHVVDEAESGPEAVEAIATVKPDVALVDVDLPGFDGYEVARRVRGRPDLDGTWLIALTGYGQARDRQRAVDAGFDEHLVKPVDPDTLVETIDTMRRRGKRSRAGVRLGLTADPA